MTIEQENTAIRKEPASEVLLVTNPEEEPPNSFRTMAVMSYVSPYDDKRMKFVLFPYSSLLLTYPFSSLDAINF